MKYRTRTYYTDGQKALMWERWKAGWTLHQKPTHPIMYGGKPSMEAVGQQPEQRELHDEQNDLRRLVSVVIDRTADYEHDQREEIQTLLQSPDGQGNRRKPRAHSKYPA